MAPKVQNTIRKILKTKEQQTHKEINVQNKKGTIKREFS